MSFTQNTNYFMINGHITNEATKLGTSGFDFIFIRKDNNDTFDVRKEDFTVPPETQWKIALHKATFVNEQHCFNFPSAEKAKTKEFNNVYQMYEIEIAIGTIKYFPLTKEVIPWPFTKLIQILNEQSEFAKPFTNNPPQLNPKFIAGNYFRGFLMNDSFSYFYRKNYNSGQPLNKSTGSVQWDNNYLAAPVIRTNLLDVIPRFGHKIDPDTSTYKLTSTQFVHVLNNLLNADEIAKINRTKQNANTQMLLWNC